MCSERPDAAEVADSYVLATEPALAAVTGIQYTAVFLTPNLEAVRQEPALYPLMRAMYVLSLLERSHLTCVATLGRNHRWLKGMRASIDANNVLTFAASLRGFLEAAADSHDILQYLPVALIECRDYLYASLHRPDRVSAELGLKELEDRLIHFAFAKRQPKDGDAPSTHKPKATTDYIRELQRFGVDGAASLYAELCELTHPAAPSVDCFLDAFEHAYTVNFGKDKESIDDILRRHNDTLIRLLMYSFNPALACMAFLARLAPGWPAPSDSSLRGIPLAAKNLPLFNELPSRIGKPMQVEVLQRALAGLAQHAPGA